MPCLRISIFTSRGSLTITRIEESIKLSRAAQNGIAVGYGRMLDNPVIEKPLEKYDPPETIQTQISNVVDSPVQEEKKREGVMAEKITANQKVIVPIFSKDQDSKQLIKNAILKNDFMNKLTPEQLERVIEAMYSRELDGNSYVITEGQIGSHLFVSAEGEFEVIKAKTKIDSFGPGVIFGELAILYNSKRLASIRVISEKAKVWVLDRKVFRQIMVDTGEELLRNKLKFLRSVPLLQKFDMESLVKMSDLLLVKLFTPGTAIVRQGDSGDTFFIISGGNVRITKILPDTNEEAEFGILGRGDYFGELALLGSDKRQATVTAIGNGVECLTLERGPFIELLGNYDDIVNKTYTDEPKRKSTPDNQEYAHIELSDLDEVGTLGVGGFGRVELVQYKRNKKLVFALKKMTKAHVIEHQQEEHAFNEKRIMFDCRGSPFIAKLYKTYKDNKYIYFLMEVCLGGDVFTILQKMHFFNDEQARFVVACVIEAFEYLHAKGYIYRDLKPENLMLDNRGYVKLIDFGFAKQVGKSGKTWTFAGTPEYIAPEIILNTGHDRAIDYWALGVLTFELLTGRPPFRGNDQLKTYNQILKGIEVVQIPKKVTPGASHLIRHLCRHKPTDRLGYQRRGVQEIKDHKWFQTLNWDLLYKGKITAPIKPIVQGLTDLNNFDKYPKSRKSPPDEFSGWDKDF